MKISKKEIEEMAKEIITWSLTAPSFIET